MITYHIRANSDSQCFLPFHYHLKLCHSHSTTIIKLQNQQCANIGTLLHIFAYLAISWCIATCLSGCLEADLWIYLWSFLVSQLIIVWQKCMYNFKLYFFIHAILELIMTMNRYRRTLELWESREGDLSPCFVLSKYSCPTHGQNYKYKTQYKNPTTTTSGSWFPCVVVPQVCWHSQGSTCVHSQWLEKVFMHWQKTVLHACYTMPNQKSEKSKHL